MGAAEPGTLGRVVLAYRRDHGESQRAFAAKVHGVSESCVSHLESGRQLHAAAGKLDALATVMARPDAAGELADRLRDAWVPPRRAELAAIAALIDAKDEKRLRADLVRAEPTRGEQGYWRPALQSSREWEQHARAAVLSHLGVPSDDVTVGARLPLIDAGPRVGAGRDHPGVRVDMVVSRAAQDKRDVAVEFKYLAASRPFTTSAMTRIIGLATVFREHHCDLLLVMNRELDADQTLILSRYGAIVGWVDVGDVHVVAPP